METARQEIKDFAIGNADDIIEKICICIFFTYVFKIVSFIKPVWCFFTNTLYHYINSILEKIHLNKA